MLQNCTVFAVSSFFQNQGVQTSLYFYEKGASFNKVWEPML